MTEEGTDSDLDDDAVNELDDWDMNEDTAGTLPAWIIFIYLHMCVKWLRDISIKELGFDG